MTARSSRVPSVALLVAAVSTAFLGVWRTTFWGPFEPRVLEIAREQYVAGNLLRVPTFSGMTFLEKPPLYYDVLALAFRAAGGPSVTAARLAHGALLVLWLLGVMLCVRRVAGPRAAILAGCLTAAANLFVKLAGRISIDVLLAASLTFSLYFLGRALASGRGPIRSGPWLVGLAFGGVAFWTKGFLGSFLFGAPLLVYAAWARDGRIVRALLRPSSIAVLLAPVAAWAALLYANGDATYVVEAFLNNTLGRFLHYRFAAADVESLEYGDVNEPEKPWYYVLRLGSLAGISLVLLPFALRAVLRTGCRDRGPRTRLSALALCFALVPPLLLSFSSQKGVHHLGSCTTGFAVAGALWLHRHAVRRDRRDVARWTARACEALAWAAPVLVALTLFGFPATHTQAVAIGIAAGVAGLGISIVSLCVGARRLAAHSLLATLMLAAIASRSPGGTDTDDLRFTEAPEWALAELGSREVGLFGCGDSDIGAFCFVMQAEHDVLPNRRDLATYMRSEEPRYCIVRAPMPPRVLDSSEGIQRVAVLSGGSREYALIANDAGARAHVSTGRSPGR